MTYVPGVAGAGKVVVKPPCASRVTGPPTGTPLICRTQPIVQLGVFAKHAADVAAILHCLGDQTRAHTTKEEPQNRHMTLHLGDIMV